MRELLRPVERDDAKPGGATGITVVGLAVSAWALRAWRVLDRLGAMVVYDLAVSSAGRVGITVGGAGGVGLGAFRTLDGSDPITAALTTATIDDPRGAAVNVAPTHVAAVADLFYVTDLTAGPLRDYSAVDGALGVVGSD